MRAVRSRMARGGAGNALSTPVELDSDQPELPARLGPLGDTGNLQTTAQVWKRC